MPSRSISDLDPLLAYAFGRAEQKWKTLRPAGPSVFLTCTYRSNAEQTAAYNQPWDKVDNDGDGKVDEADEKVTNAKAGQSPHNYLPSFAFDVAFQFKGGPVLWDPTYFDAFAKLVLEVAGITWGGNFKSLQDKPHFEITGWEKLAKKG